MVIVSVTIHHVDSTMCGYTAKALNYPCEKYRPTPEHGSNLKDTSLTPYVDLDPYRDLDPTQMPYKSEKNAIIYLWRAIET